MIEKISYDEVTSIAQQMSQGAKRMQEILNETSQKMQNVNQEDTWKSNAAADLYAKFKELSTKFEGFYSAIENYSSFLNKTVEKYREADEALASNAGNLQS